MRAQRYLSNIGTGVKILETDILTLTEQQRADLAQELQADQFESKFPGDTLAQLRWAIFEEKRRTVRTLISKIIVGKSPEGGKKGCKITPILGLDLPVDSPLNFAASESGDQSLDAIEIKPAAKFTLSPTEL